MNENKKIIGYTTGVFDMFHIGHLNILQKAKSMCDYLIVGVSTDELVQRDKNKTPVIPFAERAEIVKSICYVDQVVPQVDKNKKAAWEHLHFDKMFVGSDWQGTPQWREFEKEFAPLGVEIVYLPHTDGISSTQLTEFIKKELDDINSINNNGGGGRVVGYTTGVFDLFHIGHLNILRCAKEKCDKLIVGVSTDENVLSYKHKKPAIPFDKRVQIIKAIRYVDFVVAQSDMDKFKAWEKLHYNVMFHGSDWQNSSMYNEIEEKLRTVGVKVEFLPHTDGISSTQLTKFIKEKINCEKKVD